MKILLKKFTYLVIGLLIIFGFIIYSNIHTIKESFDNNEKIKVITDIDNIEISNYDIVTEYKNNKKDNLQDNINKINFIRSDYNNLVGKCWINKNSLTKKTIKIYF